jgi:hypothetical protein
MPATEVAGAGRLGAERHLRSGRWPVPAPLCTVAKQLKSRRSSRRLRNNLHCELHD